MGCVYTAQGFEFDYVGVVFGRDLVYRGKQGWVGRPEFSRLQGQGICQGLAPDVHRPRETDIPSLAHPWLEGLLCLLRRSSNPRLRIEQTRTPADHDDGGEVVRRSRSGHE